MINLGTTSDIIVAVMLAISQLIEPVPEAAIANAEKQVKERNSCQKFEQHKAAFAAAKCEELRGDRAQFRTTCQGLENEMNVTEVQCATDPLIPKFLRYKPRPLEQLLSLSNEQLVDELNVICNVLQDRAFLDREDWLAGKTTSRDDLGTKLVILQKPELQQVVSGIVKEAADGQFVTADAYKIATALCHWKVDRKAVAAKIDFTGGFKYLRDLINELPDVNDLPDMQQASFVYDANNHRIGEIYDREFITRSGKRLVGKVHRRRLVSKEQIPPMMFNAFMAIEDKRFKEHNGFDFETIKRLYYGGVQSTQGGSTFTMQLVKNAFFHEDVEKEKVVGRRTLKRKIKELLMIPMVESRYSKEEILTYYLNLIDLTADAQGVLMASIDLFGKEDLKQLTLSEMALLAALPKGTTKYNPRRYPEEARLRRDTVLKVMAEQGYISEAQKTQAQAEPMRLSDKVSSDRARLISRFFTGHISNHFESLKKKNLRDPRWLMGGFDIKTSLDVQLQEHLTGALQRGLIYYEKYTPGRNGARLTWKPWIDESTGKNMNIAARVAKEGKAELSDILYSMRAAHPYPDTDWILAAKTPNESAWYLDSGELTPVQGSDAAVYKRLKAYDLVVLEKVGNNNYQLAKAPIVQGAAVVLDVETGDILAMTGGFSSGPYGKFAQNNRANSLQEPGSTIKPLTYMYALNRGVQPNHILSNAAVKFPKFPGCDYNWVAKNYSEGAGSLSMRRALETSVNRALLNMFVNVAGIRTNTNTGTDLLGISSDEKQQLVDSFHGVYDLAARFGAYPQRSELKALSRDQPCFPFLLGGYETTPINMAQAYAAISNGGLRRDAVFLKEVSKAGDPIMIDRTAQRWMELQEYRSSVKQGFARAPEAFAAISGVNPIAVAQVRYIMQGILKEGTAKRMAQWSEIMGGKTGTTNNAKDVWFAGFTKKIAIVVWVGYDGTDKKNEYPNLGDGRTGSNVALPIVQDFMNNYFKMYPDRLNDKLPLPSEIPGVVREKVDHGSGRVYQTSTRGSCGSLPSTAIDEYFSSDFVKNRDRSCISAEEDEMNFKENK